MKKLVVGALAAAAFAAVGSGPVQAAHQPYEPMPVDSGIGGGPHSEFTIVVDALYGGETASMTLSCPQESSEHPNADAACDQLEAVDGYVEAIAPADGMCTKEYRPVQVIMVGHWHQAPHIFVQRYGNRCEAVLATGGVLLDF